MIRKALVEALDNAMDNGYDMLAMSDEEIADDITRFDADLEGIAPEVLVPMIATWREDKVAQ